MSRPELPEDLEVYIESYDPQGKATYISGYFDLRKTRLPFSGVMIDEYGGPNVFATLSEESLSGLRNLGLDLDGIDEIITAIQRKIMEGDTHIQLRQDSSEMAHDTKSA